MNRTLSRILTIASISAMLAGCGSSTASSTANTETDTAEETASVLRVGMECNYAPFNWSTTVESDTTQKISEVDYADGYDVVIATMLAEKIGMDVQIVKLDWDSLIVSLNKGEIDAVIAGMTDTADRREEVNFTTPYYVSEEVVIVRKDSEYANITSIAELAGANVVGQMNTLYDTIIDQIEGVNHMPAAETFPAAIQALQAGGVDAVTSELPVAVGVVAANPDLTYIQFADGQGFDDSNGDATVSIAVAKENTELLEKLQAALDTISEDDRNQLMLDAVERQPAAN